MKERIQNFISAYRKDVSFRAEVMLYVNFAVNLAYAVFEAAGGIWMRSLWAGTLAFYYIVLSVIRLNLLCGHKREDIRRKWKKYRTSGIAMLVLIVALLGIYCMTLYMEYTIVYPGYMIYAMATYTVYIVVTAIRNAVIYRKVQNPIFSASKALNVAVAAVSVYSLQSALITAFGEDEGFRVGMGHCVGAGVFIIIVGISARMISKSSKVLNGSLPPNGETGGSFVPAGQKRDGCSR